MISIILRLFRRSKDDWVGRVVYPKKEHLEYRLGDEVVGVFSYQATVIRDLGEWLEIEHNQLDAAYHPLPLHADPFRGRVAKSEVVLQSEAVEFYTTYLRSNRADEWAYINRANALQAQGAFEAAIQDLNKAIRFCPDFWVYNARALAWRDSGRFKEAIADYTTAIELDPSQAVLFHNRGNAWKKVGDLENAIADYDDAIRLNPEYCDALFNRGVIRIERKDLDGAIADLDLFIGLKSNDAEAYNWRGVAWLRKKNFKQAIQDFDDCLRLEPKWAHVHSNRGLAWEGLHEPAKALRDFDAAIQLDPKNANALRRSAVIRATNPDSSMRNGRRALDLASRLIALDDSWGSHDVMAAALAESGDFDAAVASQELALSRMNVMKVNTWDRVGAQARLHLYQNRRPCREDP